MASLIFPAFIFLNGADFSYAGSGSKAPKLNYVVAIPPLAWIAEEMLEGGNAEINVMLPPGKSPATYDPTPKEITSLQEAGIYFKIGLPFEKALIEKARENIPDLYIVDCTKGIELRRIEGGHNHGDKSEQYDPHMWLDPVNALTIADNMMLHFIQLRQGEDDTQISENNYSLKAKLDTLNLQIAEILGPYRGDTIFVFHPAFGYFTDRYGLHQVAIEKEGHEPSGKHLAELVEMVKKSGAKSIFVQPEFSDKAARAIAEDLGLKVVYLDPLAKNYPDNMLKIAHAIADALKADN